MIDIPRIIFFCITQRLGKKTIYRWTLNSYTGGRIQCQCAIFSKLQQISERHKKAERKCSREMASREHLLKEH